ncbi:MAG TPA: putative Ig domain-containing protein [Acidisarcina sp.]
MRKSALVLLFLSAVVMPFRTEAQAQIVTPLPQATPGSPYAVQLGMALNGVYPFHFSLAGGSLPDGLVLGDGGLLKGFISETKENSYTFDIRVTDSIGSHTDASFMLRVSSTVPVVVALSRTKQVLSDGDLALGRESTALTAPGIPLEHGSPNRQQGMGLSGERVESRGSVEIKTASYAPVAGGGVTAMAHSAAGPPLQGLTPNPREDGTDAAQSTVAVPSFKGPVDAGDTIKVATNGAKVDSEISFCVIPGESSGKEDDCAKAGVDGVTRSLVHVGMDPPAKTVKITDDKEISVVFDTPLTCGQIVVLVAGENFKATRVCKNIPTAITQSIGNGTSVIEGHAAPSRKNAKHKDEFDSEIRITLRKCAVPNLRTLLHPQDPDFSCESPEENLGQLRVTSMPVSNGPSGQDAYVNTDANGDFTATLQTPISCDNEERLRNGEGKEKGEYVYVSAAQMDKNSNIINYSPWVRACSPQKKLSNCMQAYNDCDESFSLVGGLEQSDLSAQDNQTGAFIRAFTRTAHVWGSIRLLGAPVVSDTQNVVSAAADPTGVLTSKSFATVGNAVDYLVGGEFGTIKTSRDGGRYSISFIAGIGATTPLTSQKLVLAYTVPPVNTVECAQLQSRFTPKNGYPVAPASFPGTPYCLYNTIGVTSPTMSNPGTQVTTLGFTNQDRSSFLIKYGGGFRTVDRFHTGKSSICGDKSDVDPEFAPCERGIVDFVVGQDEAITGGLLRRFVLKIDGVHPLPIAGSSYLYLFGSAAIRLAPNQNSSPLILQSATLTQVSVPSASVFVLPLKQPNRDFYRFGVGLNLNAIFKKLSTTTTAADKTTP